MVRIVPGEKPTKEFHQLLLSAVGPRPIAFASTVDQEGNTNLAPYSFFNAFSSRPPILIFSSNRRVRDNTTKDTLSNVEATRQVVINVVSYNIARQMALSSIEYPAEVDEFEKAGFNKLESETVKPFRVKESPVQFECEVIEIKPLGEEGGAGNLIICKVNVMHIDERVMNEDGKIDVHKIDLIGRDGGSRYVRASGDAIFEMSQPVTNIGIGFDNLPAAIRQSTVLTGNQLAALAAVERLPNEDEVSVEIASNLHLVDMTEEELHSYASTLIEGGGIEQAWRVLLSNKL